MAQPDHRQLYGSLAIVGLLMVIPYSNDIWGFALKDAFGAVVLDAVDIASRLFILEVLLMDRICREIIRRRGTYPPGVLPFAGTMFDPAPVGHLFGIFVFLWLGSHLFFPAGVAAFGAPERMLFDAPGPSALHYWLMIGPGLLIAAMVEELLCRKVLIDLLEAVGLPTVGAIVLSTVLFTGMHWSDGMAKMLSIVPTGLLMAWFYVRYRRATPLVLVHWLWNAQVFG